MIISLNPLDLVFEASITVLVMMLCSFDDYCCDGVVRGSISLLQYGGVLIMVLFLVISSIAILTVN